ncbi:MAG: YitT family protein [Eubacterium sp.]|jgi:uncharacterized membrane-anchored protein YitT (DUF2179 family)
MGKKKTAGTLAVDIIVDIIGGIFIAAGAYNFAAAANFPLTGFTGIALIINKLTGAPIGVVSMLLNIPVIIATYKIIGKDYLFASIRSLVITSLIMDIAAPHFPLYADDKMLAALCTGVLSGIGYGLIYMRGSSTGGMDFIILAIKAKRPYLTIGQLTLAIDTVVVVFGTIFVSKNINGLIYGILITGIVAVVVDKMMYGLYAGKMTLIVTDKPSEIAAAIDKIVGRGSTFLKAQGSYSEMDKDVVMCACSSKQMYEIRAIVRDTDPDAFMIIMESSEVIGEGFKAHSQTM